MCERGLYNLISSQSPVPIAWRRSGLKQRIKEERKEQLLIERCLVVGTERKSVCVHGCEIYTSRQLFLYDNYILLIIWLDSGTVRCELSHCSGEETKVRR